jgi:2-methylisocitrate lyase-like PEP mutase family enzyme
MATTRDDTATAKRIRFRELLRRDRITVMPGGFSPLYARMAEVIGFESFFLAGSQMSAFLFGVPDTGIMGLRDVVDHARHAAARTSIPIFLDGDTGFGNAVNVHYAVHEVVRAGVAGMSIEDQEAPKKSGTSAGRRCISRAEAVGKIKAAVAARNEVDAEFVICARCDLIGAEDGSFAEALARSVFYVKEGGADFVWLNSVETREQVAEACRAIPAPVLILWGGKPPAPTIPEWERLGVRVAMYPVIAATAGMQASWQVLNDLKARGTEALDDWNKRLAESPWGRADQKLLVGADKVREIEESCLPPEARRDYDTTWGH